MKWKSIKTTKRLDKYIQIKDKLIMKKNKKQKKWKKKKKRRKGRRSNLNEESDKTKQ